MESTCKLHQPAAFARGQCPSSAPAAEWSYAEEKLEADYSLPSSALSSIGGSVESGHSATLGLFVRKASARVGVDYRAVPREDGGWCAVIDKVKVSVQLIPSIRIAREIASSESCAARETMDHEMTHYRIEREAVIGLEPHVRAAASGAFSFPIEAATEDGLEKAMASLKAPFDAWIMKAIEEASAPGHSRFDQDEAQARRAGGDRCSGETIEAASRIVRTR